VILVELSADLVNKIMGKCSHCGIQGHNKTTCAIRKLEEKYADSAGASTNARELLAAATALKVIAEEESARDEYLTLRSRIEAFLSESASTNETVVQKQVLKEEVMPATQKSMQSLLMQWWLTQM